MDKKKMARIAAHYWAEKVRHPHAGDAGDIQINATASLLTFFYGRTRKRRIARFERRLANIIYSELCGEDGLKRRGYVFLDVDYDPSWQMRRAAKFAKIDLSYILPFKHCMWIYEDKIHLREGYQHEITEMKL